MRINRLFWIRLLLPALVLSVPLVTQAQQSDRTQAAQSLIETLLNGDTASIYDQFNDQVKGKLSADQFAAAMTSLSQQVGAYQSITGVREDPGHNMVIVTVQFEKAVLDAHITYDADGKLAGLNFVPTAPAETPVAPTPTYVDTSTFTEQDVTVGTYNLPGVLTMPNTTNPVPAVVLISGSGANDRDETIGPNKPFRDIAWELAAQGVASLRYDKSTLAAVHSLDLTTLTIKEEYIDDALAAIKLLRTTEGIDPDHVFLLGHSEGGYVAPRIAAAAGSDLAGVIFAAASATPLPDAIMRQTRYLVDHNPDLSDAQKQAAIDQTQAIVDQINALTPDSPADQMVFHAPPSYWLDLRSYDPVAVAQTLDLPMLFVQGGRDYQVTVKDDLSLWQAGLSDRQNVTFKIYPDLNHIFESGTGPSLPAEYQQPGNVLPEMIDDIAAWIKAQ